MTDAKDRSWVLFSTADWHTPYWTNKQHMARQLARHSGPVLYIESIGLRRPKLSSGVDLGRIWARLRKAATPLTEPEPGITVFAPLVLPFGHGRPWVRRLNTWLLMRGIRRYLHRTGIQASVWTYHPFVKDVLDQLDHAACVYHCVDDLAAIPGMSSGFRAAEADLLRRADVVFTTSVALRNSCSEHSDNVHFLSNVADADHFQTAFDTAQEPAAFASIAHPRIGYIGVLSDFKVDFPLIKHIAERHPDWQWVLIGTEREGQADPVLAQLRARPNVHDLGHCDYAELPSHLSALDCATLPTLINDYTRSMFPMKYFEYLAAGLPIVATPLDFTRTHRAGLHIADGADAFEAALEAALSAGRFDKQTARDLVGPHTWDARTAKMLNLLPPA
jgi:glycosyltransferase involved in cell wall biosynthesis